jgi:hypothetical protein
VGAQAASAATTAARRAGEGPDKCDDGDEQADREGKGNRKGKDPP